MNKNIMKKIISIATATFLSVMYLSSAMVNADDAVYPKSYSIQNVLTDFQYFINGDLTGSGHTVGAVAVGGTYIHTLTTQTNDDFALFYKYKA